MQRLLIFAVLFLIAIFAFSQFLRRTSMFFPERYPSGQWDTSQFAIRPTEHTFRTRDRVQLHAWLFRAADPRAPVMIWFHGNAGNITSRAEMAVELARRGVSVFLFDYRGFGRSEGRPSESALLRDSIAAYEYVHALHPSAIVLYGESVGGPYAAYVAKERRNAIRCVIIENSFPSLAAMGNALYKPFPIGWMAPFALTTTKWLNQAGRPVLVMHGKRDAVIPYALGRKLYEGLGVSKELLTSETAGHCEIPLHDARRYYDTVVRFATTPF